MHRYAIGLGSNRRHGRHGRPDTVIAAAVDAMQAGGVTVEAMSPIVATPPLGLGGWRYANAAALIATPLDPPALLALFKRIEREFGRRGARRWGPRVIDIDILLWSGGRWRRRDLVIPHRELARRQFVLEPLAAVAPRLRLPGGALAIRHLRARLAARAPVDRHRLHP